MGGTEERKRPGSGRLEIRYVPSRYSFFGSHSRENESGRMIFRQRDCGSEATCEVQQCFPLQRFITS